MAIGKKYAQECLLKCSPEDDNCLCILTNLTYAQFTYFLSTCTSYRGKIKGKANLLGHASYDQAKSALHHLFQLSKYKIPVDLSEKLKLFMKGMKQHIAVKKMEDGDSQIIGKKKMDFKVYKKYVSFS